MPGVNPARHPVIPCDDWRDHRERRSPRRSFKYFAYGSNLDEQQMRRRCPDSRAGRRATLEDHALAFVGHSRSWDGPVANVVDSAGARVSGLLYDVTASDLATLDRCEGHPTSYRRETRKVIDDAGRHIEAMVYLKVSGQRELGAPSPTYAEKIRLAYRRLAFAESDLEAAIARREVPGMSPS